MKMFLPAQTSPLGISIIGLRIYVVNSIMKMQHGFGFKGRMWVLIAQVPGHTCHFFLSFFCKYMCRI